MLQFLTAIMSVEMADRWASAAEILTTRKRCLYGDLFDLGANIQQYLLFIEDSHFLGRRHVFCHLKYSLGIDIG